MARRALLITAMAGLLLAADAPKKDEAGRPASKEKQPPAEGKAFRLRHGNGLRAVTFSPDGKLLATAGPGQPVRLWNTSSGKEVRQFTGHRFGILCAAFSPNGRMLAGGGQYGDDAVWLWDVATGKSVRVLSVRRGGVLSVAWSPDGLLLAAAGAGGDIQIWDVIKAAKVRELSAPTVTNGVAFSPYGKYMASADGDGVVRLWDLTTGDVVRQLKGHSGSVRSLAFAPDGQTIASGGEGDGVICLWQVATGKPCRRWKQGGGAFFAVAFAPGGRMLASADMSAVRVWDVRTAKEIGRFEANGSAVAFSPKGKRLAVGDAATVAVVKAPCLPATDKEKRAEAPLTPAQLQDCWQALGGEDAVRAHEAVWALVQAPRQTLPFLRDHLRPVRLPDVRRVRQFISELDSDDFALRQKATEELEKIGDAAAPLFEQALVGQASPEARRRVKALLDKCGRPDATPEKLRLWRAIIVLERIGSPEAGRILETLGEGAPGALATKEAAAARKRLAAWSDPGP